MTWELLCSSCEHRGEKLSILAVLAADTAQLRSGHPWVCHGARGALGDSACWREQGLCAREVAVPPCVPPACFTLLATPGLGDGGFLPE